MPSPVNQSRPSPSGTSATRASLLLKGLGRILEIDIDVPWEGRPQRRSVSGSQSLFAVGPDYVKLLRRLVARLKDNQILDDFELVYRVKMKRRLRARLNLPSRDEAGDAGGTRRRSCMI